jgi:RNA polymerase sigma factor for flagellar operon FliA
VEDEDLALWHAYRAEPSRPNRDRLILRYAPLVKFVAGRMSVGMPSNVDRRDLASYGMFGLIDAIEKFDVDTGFKFETYAVRRIRGSIVDELRSMDWVPRSVRRKARLIERAIAELERELLRSPSDAELATRLELSQEEFERDLGQISMTSVAALDGALSGSEGGLALLDTISDPDAPTPDELLDRQAMQGLLREALHALSDREQKVVALYYFEGMTLAQVGQVLGVTESRVSQIHSKIMLTLRSRLQRVTVG